MSTFAATLICAPKPYTNNSGLGIIDELKANCWDNWGNNSGYTIQLRSRGVSLRLAGFQNFFISCPFTDGDSLVGEYSGVKLEAEVGVGAKLGLFYSNSKKRLCMIGGIQGGGAGLGITGGVLKINKY